MRRRSFVTVIARLVGPVFGDPRGCRPAQTQDNKMMGGMMSPENIRGPMRTGLSHFSTDHARSENTLSGRHQ